MTNSVYWQRTILPIGLSCSERHFLWNLRNKWENWENERLLRLLLCGFCVGGADDVEGCWEFPFVREECEVPLAILDGLGADSWIFVIIGEVLYGLLGLFQFFELYLFTSNIRKLTLTMKRQTPSTKDWTRSTSIACFLFDMMLRVI